TDSGKAGGGARGIAKGLAAPDSGMAPCLLHPDEEARTLGRGTHKAMGGDVIVADGTILCLNAGSSSLKFAVYGRPSNPGGETTPLAAGAVERIGLSRGRLRVSTEGAGGTETEGEYKDHSSAVQAVLDLLERRGLPALDAVGHRLVHGGPTHTTPERLDARLMESLRELAPLAPLHLPGELSVIEAVSARFPTLPQVVCFDTAFHHRM